ncbi:MAG: hypothetical protein WD058_04415 [Dehalococcoidia bacterium]
MSDAMVRPAAPGDAEEVRSLVTRALLTAGFPPPDADLDADLLDLSYYNGPGRSVWVAERDGFVVGCAAIDVGEARTAVLRRLAGGSLGALVKEALRFAAAEGYRAVETVLPPGLPGTADTLGRAGFEAPSDANPMLLRLDLS